MPNQFGGRENLEAIEFLQAAQHASIEHECPGAFVCAEESTSWPGVTRPVHLGGLGFTYKWNMGWMHDMLDYMKEDPVHRKWHHNKITFSMLYAYSENFVLPFSHDEVVHGKRSMLDKMPGDVVAEARQPARALRLHVRASRQEADVHGRRDRPVARVEPRLAARLGSARRSAPRRPAALGPRSQSLLRARSVAVGGRLRARRLLVDRLQRSRAQHHCADRGRDSRASRPTSRSRSSTSRRCRDATTASACRSPATTRELLNSDAEVYGGSNIGNQGRVAAEAKPSHGYDWSLT